MSIVTALLVGAVILAAIAIRAHRHDLRREVGVTQPRKAVVPTLEPIELSSGLKSDRRPRPVFQASSMGEVELLTIIPSRAAVPIPADGEDFLDTRRTVMRCTTCQRSFDLGASYCTNDGEPLVFSEEDAPHTKTDTLMECPECGIFFDRDSLFCPEDGARLRPQLLDDSEPSYGAIPIGICTNCCTEYPISQVVCPVDGQPLLLLVGRKTGATPLHGYGPRNMICPKCCERFSNESLFCGTDGTELVSLN